MNLNEYQRLALRTSGAGHDRVKNGCLGLTGESGEIVDIVKKYMFQSGENPPFPKDKFIKEMGDVLWYCAETVSGMELELEEVTLRTGSYDKYSLFAAWNCADIELTAAMLSANAVEAYVSRFVEGNAMRCAYRVRDIYKGLLHLCDLVGVTIDEVADTNIEKLKKRYPDGFDPERSIHRPEYERKEQTESASTNLFTIRNKAL